MKLIYVLLLIAWGGLSGGALKAQSLNVSAPTDCADATWLLLDGASKTFTLAATDGPERWVRFVVPHSGVAYSVSARATQGTPHLNVFKGASCENLFFLSDFAASNLNSFQKAFSGWQAGETVWINLENVSSDIKLSIGWEKLVPYTPELKKVNYMTAMALVNDDCVNATPLTGTGTNVGAIGNDWGNLGGTCTWSSTDNSVFYSFDVLSETSPNPIQITLFNVQCTGGGAAIQLALYTNCNGGGGVNDPGYRGCASGVGNVTITANQVLPPGTYILAVDGSSGAGCTWDVSSSLLAPIANFDSVRACQGSCVSFTDHSQNAPTSWQWSFPGGTPSSSTAQNPTNICYNTPGVFPVTLIVNSGTGADTLILNNGATINPPSAPPSVNSNSPVVCGSTLNLTAAASSQGSFVWTGPNSFSSALQNPTINSATSLNAGTYSVTFTDGNGCTSSASTDVVIIPLPAPAVSSNTPVCVGGTVNLTATSSTPGNFAWTGPNSFTSLVANPVITNVSSLNGGTYTVTFSLPSGCSSTNTTDVVITPLPAAPLLSSNSPLCLGGNLSLTAAGPSGATYQWTGPNGFSSAVQNPTITAITAAAAGAYSATTTLAGCTSPVGITQVTINPNPAAVQPTVDSPICAGRTLFLAAPNVPGASFSWTGPNGFTSNLQNPTITNTTTDNAGTYSVTITDANGCVSAPGTVTAIINPIPAIASLSSNSPVCVGGSLTLTAGVPTGVTFSWTGPGAFTSAQANPTITNVTTNNTGTYSLTVSLNGCTSLPASLFVQVQAKPSVVVFNNSAICEGQTLNLMANPLPDPNTSYSWAGPNGFTAASKDPSIPTATVAANGDYSLTITTSTGCTAVGVTHVVVYAKPPTPAPTNNGPICAGQPLAFVVPSVGIGATYQWIGPNAFISSTQNPILSNPTSAASGTYNVTATINGCKSDPGTTTVTVNPIPASPIVGNNGPICEGTDLNLTAEPIAGAFYSWTGPKSFTSVAQNPQLQAVLTANAGAYSLVVTVNGCTSPVGVTTVLIRPKPAAPVAGNNGPKCEGEPIQLTASTVSGATYRWTGPNGFVSNQQNPLLPFPTVNSSGLYQVIARKNGCDSDPGFTVVTVKAIPAMPIINTNSPLCEGQTLNLTAQTITGASYLWAGENGFASNQQNPSIPNVTTVNADSYFLTITVNGCTSPVATTTVIINPTPDAPFATNDSPKCAGDPINLSASTIAGASYNWTGPGFISALQNPVINSPTTLSSGTYSVTATVEGCTSPAGETIVFVKPTPGNPSVNNNGPLCAGKQLNLTVAPVTGATYLWAGPNGFTSIGTNPIIPNAGTVNSGFYSVLVTLNGCTSPVGVTQVVILPAPALPVVGNNSPFCEGGQLQLTASLTPGATYAWTGPAGFASSGQNPIISPATTVNSGGYSLTVTAGGCSAGPAITSVTIRPRPATPIAGNNGPVCAGQVLNLTANLVAGASYFWTGPSSFVSTQQNPIIPNANAANAGVYSVTITLNGCTSSTAQTLVTVNPSPGLIAAGNNGPVCVGATLNLTSTFVANATYQWTGPAGFTSISQNPIVFTVTTANAGIYTVQITLPGNCVSTAQTEVLVPSSFSPTATFASQTASICSGQPLATAVYLTGTGPWTVEYSANGVIQPPLVIGNSSSPSPFYYPLTVNVTGNTTLTLTGVRSGTSCNGATNSTLIATVVPTPTVQWVSNTTSLCGGDVAPLLFQVTGKGPWTISLTRNGVAETVTIGNAGSPSPFSGGPLLLLTQNTTFTITGVQDANGCTGQIAGTQTSAVYNVAPRPDATIGGPTAVCPNNQALTTVTVTQAGSAPWILTYIEGGVLKTMTGTGNGTFQLITASLNTPTTVQLVSIANANTPSCSRNLTGLITIGITSNPVVSGTPTAPDCLTQTGSITASGSGGVAPYEFAINGPSFGSNNVFTGLAPGTYTLYMRDANGCTAGTTVVVPGLGTPQIISVTNIEANRAVVTWTTIPGAQYRLRYRRVGTQTWTQVNNIPATTAATLSRTITGLTANAEYEVQVQAFCTNLVSPWSPSTNFNTAPPCGTPTNVTLTFVSGSTTQAQVNWTSVTNASCYDLQYHAVGGVWQTVQVTDAQNPFVLPITLLASTTYEVRMRAYCFSCPSSSVSPFAPIASLTTPSSPCPPSVRINNGATSIVGCGSATLIATFSTTLTTTPQIIWRDGDGNVVATNTQVLTVTQPGTYTVQVIFAGCTPVTSQPIVVTIDLSQITLVVNGINVSCTSCTDGTVEATAIISSGGSPTFEYSLVGPQNRDWQLSNKFFNLPAGTYTVRVRIQGSACVITKDVTVGGPTLQTPVITSITNILTNRATINYTSVPGAVSYTLRYRVVGSDVWEVITGIVGNSRILLSLQNNTQYEVQVQAVSSGGGTSAWSPIQVFTTIPQTVSCPTPGGVFSQVINAGSVIIRWNNVSNATCYEIDYRISGPFTTVSVQPNQNPFTLAGLSAGQVYQFRVRAICSACGSTTNASSYSPLLTFTLPTTRGGATSFTQTHETLRVYPNPTRGALTLDFESEGGETEIAVLDVTGKRVLRETITAEAGQTSHSLNLEALPAGVYVLRLTQGARIQTVKVMVR